LGENTVSVLAVFLARQQTLLISPAPGFELKASPTISSKYPPATMGDNVQVEATAPHNTFDMNQILNPFSTCLSPCSALTCAIPI
jgi:hypothetical protein